MATTDLTRTPSSGGNRKIWTFSAWLKRAVKSDTNNSRIFSAGDAQTDYTTWFMGAVDGTDGRLFFQNRVSNTTTELASSRQFRDANGWYHLVIACDTTQATDSNRVKIYVNGVQETLTGAYPAQDVNTFVNHTVEHNIGSADGAGYTPRYWAGSMSHVHLVDGLALAPTVFGHTDSTTGEWKIKASPNYTVGTNGFFILKDGNSVTDQSTNTNNFTVSGGTLTKTEDNPSNVFCTMNSLVDQGGFSFTQGNNTVTWSTDNKSTSGTLGMVTGKYYWEMKYSNATGGSNAMIGVGSNNFNHNTYVGATAGGWSYYAQGGTTYNANSYLSYGSGWTAGDIIGVAFDANSRTIWFSKNGTWQDSATISEIAAGTTTNSAYTNMGSAGDTFFPVISAYNGNVCQFNFGNGYFGTTEITTNTGTGFQDADSNGRFYYTVPTGFRCVSTKGLNQ